MSLTEDDKYNFCVNDLHFNFGERGKKPILEMLYMSFKRKNKLCLLFEMLKKEFCIKRKKRFNKQQQTLANFKSAANIPIVS